MNRKYIILIFSAINVVVSTIPNHLVFHEENIEDHGLFKKKLEKLQISVLSFQKFTAFSYGDDVMLKYKHEIFNEFLSVFQRNYKRNNTEYQHRFAVFQESLARHSWLNMREEANNGTAKYGINKFSDWTTEEFQSMLSIKRSYANRFNNGYAQNITNVKQQRQKRSSISPNDCYIDTFIPYPKTVNWRKKITPVKNQKNCGSCWAFVAAEQIETYDAIKGNPLVERSPQELLSCAPSLGCNGGNTCSALLWMVNSESVLVSEKQYPYVQADEKCEYDSMIKKGPKVKTVCGCNSLKGREELMLHALHQKGPLAVNVDAVLWHDYIGGIIQHHCTDYNMNHAVQIVGYDLSSGPVPYWIARNQWGSSFGEDGFMRIKYGRNLCGVADEPSFVVTS